jgi:hypothetical protein
MKIERPSTISHVPAAASGEALGALSTSVAPESHFEGAPESPRPVRAEPRRDETSLSPLAALAKQAEAAPQPARELSRERAPVTTAVELPFEALTMLAALEGLGSADAARLFDRVRRGSMLLTSDAQSLRAGTMPIASDRIDAVAAPLARGESARAVEVMQSWGKLEAAFFAGSRDNVQAFVQRVLRECYLIQSDLLMDYAAKVQFNNDLKKRIREQLHTARDARAAWVGGVAPSEPFAYVDFDGNGAAFVSEAAPGTQPRQESGSQVPLTAEQRDLLDAFRAGSIAIGDDRMQDVLGLLQSLPFGELRDVVDRLIAQFGPMLVNPMASAAAQAMGQILVDVLRSVSPVQAMDLLRHYGWSDTSLPVGPGMVVNLGAETQLELRLYLREAARSVMGDDIPEGAVDTAFAETVLDWVTHAATSESGATTSRAVRTTEEMDAYIQHLEERLNSVGDDAQLANADLQNALQQQQQTLQMMSNLSKMLHETCMAIVRKVGT